MRDAGEVGAGVETLGVVLAVAAALAVLFTVARRAAPHGGE